MTALFIKDSGEIFLITELPEQPIYSDYVPEDQGLVRCDYENALKKAKSSSIRVVDQEQAKELIWDELKKNSPAIKLESGAIYPIPGLKFKTWFNEKLEEVAILLPPMKEETPEKPDFDLIKWLEEERNILQNTGSLMWHKPAEQAKALEVADHIDKTLQYIKLSGVASKEEQPINSELLEALKEYHDLFQRMIDNGMVNAAVGSPIRIKAKRVIEKVELKSKGENN